MPYKPSNNTVFTLSDGSTTQAIEDANTLIVTGGTGVTAAVSATDTVTLSIGQAVATTDSPQFAKIGIGTVADAPIDVKSGTDLPQAILRYNTTHRTDMLTTSNGTFRMTPTARTVQVDTGDNNGGNIQFTKAGGVLSGAISWDTGDKDVTLYSDANLYLGAGGSAADLTINADGSAAFGGVVTAAGFTIGSAAITEAELEILDGATLSTTELNFVDGVTSAIQTQLDAKQAADADLTALSSCQTGSAVALALLTATEVGILDGATLSTAELNYVDGVTSSVQTQLDAKGPVAGSGSIVTVGTIGTGTWNADVIPSAKLDADTAHLSGTQTFTGAKTFSADVVISGTTPTLTIGDAGAEDTNIVFDGAAADFRIGIDDGTDTLEIGVGAAHGTTACIKVDSSTNVQIAHNSAVADGQYSGTVAVFQAGEDLSAGECVYLKSDGKMWKAVATAAATSRCVAMATMDISANGFGAFLMEGFIRLNSAFPTWTIGGALYTPEAEQSNLNIPEQAAPDTDGDFVQVLGFAISGDAIWFSPDSTVIEVA